MPKHLICLLVIGSILLINCSGNTTKNSSSNFRNKKTLLDSLAKLKQHTLDAFIINTTKAQKASDFKLNKNWAYSKETVQSIPKRVIEKWPDKGKIFINEFKNLKIKKTKLDTTIILTRNNCMVVSDLYYDRYEDKKGVYGIKYYDKSNLVYSPEDRHLTDFVLYKKETTLKKHFNFDTDVAYDELLKSYNQTIKNLDSVNYILVLDNVLYQKTNRLFDKFISGHLATKVSLFDCTKSKIVLSDLILASNSETLFTRHLTNDDNSTRQANKEYFDNESFKDLIRNRNKKILNLINRSSDSIAKKQVPLN